jgi:hypothetical protein
MAIYQEKTKMTQRKLTADEQFKARRAYMDIGGLYGATDSAADLVQACCLLAGMIQNNTSDGKPLRTDRVPTAADVGKSVKVRSNERNAWWGPCYFVGIRRDGLFVVESPSGGVTTWAICVIDQEAEG